MTNLDMIRGRSTALTLTNRSGSARTQGDLVIVDTTNDESFTTSTASNTKTIIGVVDEAIGITSNGRVVVEGYARAVKTLGTSARGDYLYHSTTAATAAHLAGSTPDAGAFGYVLDGGAGTLTTALIFPTEQGGGGVPSISHTSNTFTGAVTLTASGTLGITSPASGTFNLSATGGGAGASDLAGQELDYVQYTAGQVNITATTEATANTLVTNNGVAFDGSTAIYVEFEADLGTGTTYTRVALYDGASSIGWYECAFHGGIRVHVRLRRKLTPSAATHTYSWRGWVDAGTGFMSNDVGGSTKQMPAYSRITRV